MGLGGTPDLLDYYPQSNMTGYETADLGLSPFTAEIRVSRDAALKQLALNAGFLRHLLRTHPLDGLDEVQIASLRPASANLIGPDLSQRHTDAAWQIELRDGSLACTCCWNTKPSLIPRCRSGRCMRSRRSA